MRALPTDGLRSTATTLMLLGLLWLSGAALRIPLLGVPPVLPPYHLMLNADLLAPFSLYGTTPATAGYDIRSDWSGA